MTTRVAVIGAGAAGLAQLAQLRGAFARPGAPALDAVCFEARDAVGGTWIADRHPAPFLKSTVVDGGEEKTFIYPPAGHAPSPMYDQLRTNLPHDLMSFRDHPFPEGTPLFPDSETVLAYLESYAARHDLAPLIRFRTRVERVYLSPTDTSTPARRWTIESADLATGARAVETFDYVSVANGHYSDTWVPPIRGLSTFPGTVLHSRQYRRPEDYAGRTVLVVGSFASGSDVARQIATLNVAPDTDGAAPRPPTKVYQSSSGTAPKPAAGAPAYARHITPVPLIDRFEPPSPAHPAGAAVLVDGRALGDVDVVIFATGYNYAFPFFKQADAPWATTHRLVDGAVGAAERRGGDGWEVGGLKGLGMSRLDELLLFLDGDRSMAFPALPYQVVPFPLAEMQARLVALLWAGLLPSFPAHPQLPPNPNNPYFSAPSSSKTENGDAARPNGHAAADAPDGADGSGADGPATAPSAGAPPVRTVFRQRQKLVFVAPYEWTYAEYLMRLAREAEGGAEPCWTAIEGWRRARRDDKDLRVRTLGY